MAEATEVQLASVNVIDETICKVHHCSTFRSWGIFLRQIQQAQWRRSVSHKCCCLQCHNIITGLQLWPYTASPGTEWIQQWIQS